MAFQHLLCLALIATVCSAQSIPPSRVPITRISANAGTCPSASQRNEAISQLSGEISQALSARFPATTLAPTQAPTQAPTACSTLPANSPSGYYMIQPSTGQPAVQVYCDFNRQCGCGESSTWTRIAFLNMSDPNEVCPPNWETYTTPVRACGNGQSGPSGGCDSIIYPSMGQSYSRVCGRVIGYQHSDTTAFSLLIDGITSTIDEHYLDGVSITHGSVGSRQHIWSFTSAFGDAFVVQQPQSACSCSSGNPWPYSTSFVGDDYFCDTGSHTTSSPNIIYSSDPLWDGAGCGPESTCCTFNSPPWFCKALPQPTTDDLEVRICDRFTHRDTPVELIEILVQ